MCVHKTIPRKISSSSNHIALQKSSARGQLLDTSTHTFRNYVHVAVLQGFQKVLPFFINKHICISVTQNWQHPWPSFGNSSFECMNDRRWSTKCKSPVSSKSGIGYLYKQRGTGRIAIEDSRPKASALRIKWSWAFFRHLESVCDQDQVRQHWKLASQNNL